jgi:hypothetical protein
MVFSVFSRGAKVRLNLTFMARLYLRSGLVFLSLRPDMAHTASLRREEASPHRSATESHVNATTCTISLLQRCTYIIVSAAHYAHNIS